MSALAAAAVSAVSAEPSGEAAKSGPIGLGIILLLCVACYFLFKSMSKHLKHVREDFPGQQRDPASATPTPPAKGGNSAVPAEAPGPDADVPRS